MTTSIRAGNSAAAARAGAAVALPLLKRQLTFLAAALFIVSLGYGALLPVLPGWLAQFWASTDAAEVARHVGFLTGAYVAGVLIGAPLWGFVSDRIGRSRILIAGMVGYVASMLLLLLAQSWGNLWVIYALRTSGHSRRAGDRRRTHVRDTACQTLCMARRSVTDRLSLWTSAQCIGRGSRRIVRCARRGGIGRPGHLDLGRPGCRDHAGMAWTLPARLASAVSADTVAATDRSQNLVALFGLSGMVMFVLSGFEVGIVLQGQQHVGLTTQQISLMFAECSLAMLAVNALLFFTSALEKAPSRALIVVGMLLGLAGLAVLAVHEVTGWMYLGVSLTAAGIGLLLPVIAYLAAGTSSRRLGATMGGIAAASGLGQVLGSAAGGWLFGKLAQSSFAWLSLPPILTLVILSLRPGWGLRQSAARKRSPREAGGHAT